MMQQGNLTGIYGKLPAHGDFIYRDLSPHFINVWDSWLQAYMGSSQEQLGESWLDLYMTSPIWRFAFSAGVVDEHAYAGIMLPSVDRVGRYFPFSVITRLPAHINPTEFICNRGHWYHALEDAALRALDGSLVLDELIEELNDSMPMNKETLVRGHPIHSPVDMVVKTGLKDAAAGQALPFMLDACLSTTMQSYSIWSTAGSEIIHPCLFVANGLPQLSGVAAMLDGQWQQWHWQEPYPLK